MRGMTCVWSACLFSSFASLLEQVLKHFHCAGGLPLAACSSPAFIRGAGYEVEGLAAAAGGYLHAEYGAFANGPNEAAGPKLKPRRCHLVRAWQGFSCAAVMYVTM